MKLSERDIKVYVWVVIFLGPYVPIWVLEQNWYSRLFHEHINWFAIVATFGSFSLGLAILILIDKIQDKRRLEHLKKEDERMRTEAEKQVLLAAKNMLETLTDMKKTGRMN